MCRVHAHVERTIGAEAETPLGILELRGRDTKVEEHAAARLTARVSRHERGEIGKRRMAERKPHFVGKARSPGRNGLRIAVDREQAALLTQALEDPCRMTAAPKSRIDIVTARFEGQSRERLIDKHWRVLIHDRSGGRPPPESSRVMARCAPSRARYPLLCHAPPTPRARRASNTLPTAGSSRFRPA